MTSITPDKAAPQGERDARHAVDEARIVAAWTSEKYRIKKRCLEALGLEKLNNAALWKRVRRAIDRDGRRTTNASTD